MERKLDRQTYAELKTRNEKGEINIEIRYSNGILYIVYHFHDVNRPSILKVLSLHPQSSYDIFFIDPDSLHTNLNDHSNVFTLI